LYFVTIWEFKCEARSDYNIPVAEKLHIFGLPDRLEKKIEEYDVDGTQRGGLPGRQVW